MTTAHPGPGPDDRHRAVREQLGAYVLGGLPGADQLIVENHLAGCTECRASLDELRPLAAPLAALDPDDLEVGEAEAGGDPSPGGFAAIRDRIRAEAAADPPTVRTPAPPDPPTVRVAPPSLDPPTVRGLGPVTSSGGASRPAHGPADVVVPMRRRGFRLRLAAAAAVVALVAGGLGALLGSGASGGDGKPVTVQALTPGVDATAGVVPHSWGVEIKLAATGFEPGRVYRASVLDRNGTPVSAGEFVGTGSSRMRCNLNSSVLADQATGFVVTDTDGTPVLRSGPI